MAGSEGDGLAGFSHQTHSHPQKRIHSVSHRLSLDARRPLLTCQLQQWRSCCFQGEAQNSIIADAQRYFPLDVNLLLDSSKICEGPACLEVLEEGFLTESSRTSTFCLFPCKLATP